MHRDHRLFSRPTRNSVSDFKLYLRLWVLALLLAVLTVHCMGRGRSSLIPNRILLLHSLHRLGLFARDSEIIRSGIRSWCLLEPCIAHCIFLRLSLIMALLSIWTHMDHLNGLTDVEIRLDHHTVNFNP